MRNGRKEYFVPLVLKRDNYTCFRCGYRPRLHLERMQVHHFRPICMGGQDDIANMVTLCERCHKLTTYWFFQEYPWLNTRKPMEEHKPRFPGKRLRATLPYPKGWTLWPTSTSS